MAALHVALQELGITADVELDGRWVAIRGAKATAYVVETDWGNAFFVWCDIPEERAVARHADAVTAIREGLRRADGPPRATGGAALPTAD